MDHDLSLEAIAMLLIFERLDRTRGPISRENITYLAEIKLPDLAEKYDQMTADLQNRGLIQAAGGELSLTTAGRACLQTLLQSYSLNTLFYDAYYQAVMTSQAHALFCEKAYGKNLAQHGAADMDQIEVLLQELQLTPAMTLLDFGCGDGRIAEYISDRTQVCVSGIDISARAIELARQRTADKRERLRFYCGDIEEYRGELPAETFDRIMAIDSIFFTRDQKTVVERFLKLLKKDGKMGIFYLCPPQGESAFDPGQTALGQALNALGLRYTVRDLSQQNYQHWMKKRAALDELEPLFYQEGQAFLFKNRTAECRGGVEHFPRCLFVVEAP